MNIKGIIGMLTGGSGTLGPVGSIAGVIGGNKKERYEMLTQLHKSRILNILTLLVGITWLAMTINNGFFQYYPKGVNAELLTQAYNQLSILLGGLIFGKASVMGFTAKQRKQMAEGIMAKQEAETQEQVKAIAQAEEVKTAKIKKRRSKHKDIMREITAQNEKDAKNGGKYWSKVIELKRNYTPFGVLGRFIVHEGKKKKVICYSYELPWMDNTQSISCIPWGTYQLEWAEESASGKLKNILILQDPPNRSSVLIHAAGDKKPLDEYIQGCIIPLMDRPKKLKRSDMTLKQQARKNAKDKYWAKAGETTQALGKLVDLYNAGYVYLKITGKPN